MVIEKPMPSDTYISDRIHNEEYKPQAESLNYPKGVYFVMGCEFFERLTYYGISTALSTYLKESLEIPSSHITVTKQVFLMFSYCFPLIGAMLSDCWLNKFRTIMYMMPVYAAGTIVVLISSIPGFPGAVPVAMTGLVLTYLGLGGVRPNIVAFGGDQFVVPQQETYLKKYFSAFYFAINAGSFAADISVPVVCEKQCFGRETCFFAGFCIVSISIIFSGIILASGRKYYYIRKPDCNIVMKMLRCICYALKKPRKKLRRKKTKSPEHWLDKAADKYDPDFINDVKVVLRIIVLFLPLPFFRALFDQHGSRWFDQAARMSGDIGKLKLEAEQIGAANSIFVLLFIPLFEAFLYPALAKYNFLKKPLQRLTVGGLLAALAFVVSALVETQLEPTDEYAPRPREAQVRFYNGLPDPLILDILAPVYGRQVIPSLEEWSKLDIPARKKASIKVKYSLNGTERIENFQIVENELTSYIITPQRIVRIDKEDAGKSKEGAPRIKVIYVQPAPSVEVVTINCDSETSYILTQDKPYISYEENLDCDKYRVESQGKIIYQNDDLAQGGVYVGFVMDKDGVLQTNTLTLVPPNSVHMLWLVPQYVLITAGEVMFSITGFEFSYTQAPVSMKALLQATWLLTAALGKVIVLSAGKTKLSNRLFSEFMLFAALMAVDMFIFAALAMRYQYVDSKKEEEIPDQFK